MKVEGIDRVIATLKRTLKKSLRDGVDPSVSVGYETNYALFVHENIGMKWKGKPRRPPAKGEYWGPAGQAKYLEQPAREGAKEIAALVRRALQAGHTLLQSLVVGGLWLQAQSQRLVPVDSGDLKESAFTRRDV